MKQLIMTLAIAATVMAGPVLTGSYTVPEGISNVQYYPGEGDWLYGSIEHFSFITPEGEFVIINRVTGNEESRVHLGTFPESYSQIITKKWFDDDDGFEVMCTYYNSSTYEFSFEIYDDDHSIILKDKGNPQLSLIKNDAYLISSTTVNSTGSSSWKTWRSLDRESLP